MGRNKSRKSTVPHKSKLKKDPGVPKLPDLKIKNAEKRKPRSPPPRTDPDATMASEPTLSSLAILASSIQDPDQSQSRSSDPSSSTSTSTAQKTKEQLRRHYVRALYKVIDESDVIILVLDARDPEGCRSRLVEEEVRRRESEGKKLVFILNKIDLVPRENAQQWLRYLRHSTPTLPFRSVSANQRSNLSSATAPALLRLLKAYKPSAAQTVTVGVVGFPNVGKSSLINSLKRSKACAVAAQPGHTKDLQTVQLERGLKIIDSPGVVFDEDDDQEAINQRQKGSILLRNVVKVEDIDDPIAVVEEILVRTEPATIRNIYNLFDFSNTLTFLTMLALSSGRLLKGGTPDVLSAARQVLVDWNHQKIPYYSVPPTIHPSMIPSTISSGPGGTTTTVAPGAETVGQAQIVTQFSAPFALAGLFDAADVGAFGETAVKDGEEVPMMTMENDVQEEGEGGGGGGDVDRMIAEDSPLHVPQKRTRSPSPSSFAHAASHSQPRAESGTGTGTGTQVDTSDGAFFVRMPKRFRRTKDLSAYEEAAGRRRHALDRKTLKKDAKRAKRTAVRMDKQQQQQARVGSGMDVEVETLHDTFMVGIES